MVWGYVHIGSIRLLAAASLRYGDAARVSPAWLFVCYVLLSIAELFLGPLTMSLVTRLAPEGRSGQAIGLWLRRAPPETSRQAGLVFVVRLAASSVQGAVLASLSLGSDRVANPGDAAEASAGVALSAGFPVGLHHAEQNQVVPHG